MKLKLFISALFLSNHALSIPFEDLQGADGLLIDPQEEPLGKKEEEKKLEPKKENTAGNFTYQPLFSRAKLLHDYLLRNMRIYGNYSDQIYPSNLKMPV